MPQSRLRASFHRSPFALEGFICGFSIYLSQAVLFCAFSLLAGYFNYSVGIVLFVQLSTPGVFSLVLVRH